MKLLWLLVLAVIACRLLLGRWPWQFLGLGGERSASVERARRLLGVGAGASREDIVEAHRRRLAEVHPDRGGSNEDVHATNAARDTLLKELPQTMQER